MTSLDEAALLHAIALNTQSDQEIAARFGMTVAELREKTDNAVFLQKVLNTREELAKNGKDIERRSQHAITEHVIPTAIDMMGSPELTPDELVKIGLMLHKFSGSDKKATNEGGNRPAPMLSIHLRGDDNKPAVVSIGVVNPQFMRLSEDLEDVPFIEADK